MLARRNHARAGMNICQFGVLAALCLYGQAYANELPSPVDLRAAYCIRALQEGVATLQTEPRSDFGKQSVEQGGANIRRMQEYLAPRLPRLDMTQIVFAMASASRDYRTLQDASNACMSKVEGTDRQMTCIQSIPVLPRLKACSDPSFLPY